MIELIILNHLDNELDVPVYLEHPASAPEEFVLFEKTGSAKSETMPSATIAFQSYSDSLFGAATLNEEVKQTVEELILLNEIRKVELNSDYNFTDTQTKRYRYQAVYEIYYY